jgi:hypothetical protein
MHTRHFGPLRIESRSNKGGPLWQSAIQSRPMKNWIAVQSVSRLVAGAAESLLSYST